jgi:hypothetical protein
MMRLRARKRFTDLKLRARKRFTDLKLRARKRFTDLKLRARKRTYSYHMAKLSLEIVHLVGSPSVNFLSY